MLSLVAVDSVNRCANIFSVMPLGLPTLNLENPDPASERLDLVRGPARQMSMEHAISNGFGFGGVNASVIFRRWE